MIWDQILSLPLLAITILGHILCLVLIIFKRTIVIVTASSAALRIKGVKMSKDLQFFSQYQEFWPLVWVKCQSLQDSVPETEIP